MTWYWWVVFVGVLIFAPIAQGYRQQRRARRQQFTRLTPEQRQEAFYRSWKPAIKKSKEPQEFYDVEKEGL